MSKVSRLAKALQELSPEECADLIYHLRCKLLPARPEVVRRTVPFPHPVHIFSEQSATTQYSTTSTNGRFSSILMLLRESGTSDSKSE